jgi:hypothetical protein
VQRPERVSAPPTETVSVRQLEPELEVLRPQLLQRHR